MLDPRDVAAAAWGLAGALAYGLYMVLQAFRTPNANPGARSSALLDLAYGVLLGPLASAILTPFIVKNVPALDPRAVAVNLGLISVPILPRYLRWLQAKIMTKLGDDASPGSAP